MAPPSPPTPVVALAPAAKPLCNQDAIDRLEEALKQAKAGELIAVAIAAVTSTGAITRAWSSCELVGPLIGAVANLQHELIDSAD